MKTFNEDNNFLAIEEKYSNYNDSNIVIQSVPYEHTVSYGEGTINGPKEIIKASAYVEFYDDEFDNELCFSEGIATLYPIDLNGCYDKKMIDKVAQCTGELLKDDKFVVTLGGEHTISTAPILAHFNKYNNLSVLHFDAHSDLRDIYQNNKYSHACFAARVCEFLDPKKLTQVGIRAQCIEESIFIKEQKVNTFYASAIKRGSYGTDWMYKLVDTLSNEIYITFDLDFFDPAIMPATGTPEPDGFNYNDALNIFRIIRQKGKKIVGFDVVELSPMDGLSHPNILAARLVYKLLNMALAK